MRPTNPPLLNAYIVEAARTPLLSAADERELGARIRAGCKDSRDRFVRANLRLVVNLARRFQGRGLELVDLVAEGNLGLIRAVDKFDPELGCRFSTYATWWVTQSIRYALRNQVRMVRLPSHLIDRLSARLKARRMLSLQLGREPTDDEVSVALGLDVLGARRLQASVETSERAMTSLSTRPSTEGAETGELIADDAGELPGAALELVEERDKLRTIVERLDPRRRLVIRLRFGLDGNPRLTLEQVGARLGLTRERARQLEMQALDWLRQGFTAGAGAMLAPAPARLRRSAVRRSA